MTVAEMRKLLEGATPRPWRAGRPDMQSFDGVTGEPFTNLYWDDPDEKMHLGHKLPGHLAKCVSKYGDKPDAALIVAAVNHLGLLLDVADAAQELADAAEIAASSVGLNINLGRATKAKRALDAALAKLAEGAGR